MGFKVNDDRCKPHEELSLNTAFLIDNDLVMTNVLLAWEQDRLFGFSGRKEEEAESFFGAPFFLNTLNK